MEDLSLDQLELQYHKLLEQAKNIRQEIDRRINHRAAAGKVDQLQSDLFNEYGVYISYEGDNRSQLIGDTPVITIPTWAFIVNPYDDILYTCWGLDMLNMADPRFEELVQNIALIISSERRNTEIPLNVHIRTNYQLGTNKMSHHTEFYYFISSKDQEIHHSFYRVLRTDEGDFKCNCNHDFIYSLEGQKCGCNLPLNKITRRTSSMPPVPDGAKMIYLPIL